MHTVAKGKWNFLSVFDLFSYYQNLFLYVSVEIGMNFLAGENVSYFNILLGPNDTSNNWLAGHALNIKVKKVKENARIYGRIE